MNQFWSYLLTIVGLAGFILAGRKVWWCWYVNIACQALWFTYAIVTHQYGFIIASIAYTIVFTKNAIEWTKEHRKSQEWDLNEYAFNIETFQPMQDYAEKDVELTREMYRRFDDPRPIWNIYVYNDKFNKSGVLLTDRQTEAEAEETGLSWLNTWPKDIVMLVKDESWTR